MGTTGQPIPPDLITKFQSANWIWTPEPGIPGSDAPEGDRAFRKWHHSTGPKSVSALILITVDNIFTLFVNGNRIGGADNFMKAQIYNVTLEPEDNVFAVKCTNYRGVTETSAGPAGLLAAMQISFEGGETPVSIVSDSSWNGSQTIPPGFESPSFNESTWGPAISLAKYGDGIWGDRVEIPPNIQAPVILPGPVHASSASSVSPSVVQSFSSSVSGSTGSSPTLQSVRTTTVQPTQTTVLQSITGPTITSTGSHGTGTILGPILGGAIGGIGVLSLLILAFVLFYRLRRKKVRAPVKELERTVSDNVTPFPYIPVQTGFRGEAWPAVSAVGGYQQGSFGSSKSDPDWEGHALDTRGVEHIPRRRGGLLEGPAPLLHRDGGPASIPWRGEREEIPPTYDSALPRGAVM